MRGEDEESKKITAIETEEKQEELYQISLSHLLSVPILSSSIFLLFRFLFQPFYSFYSSICIIIILLSSYSFTDLFIPLF